MRGLPHDDDRLLHRGHDTPPWFDRAPAVDGRWHPLYVEVPFEYPIALLPFVLLPSFIAGETFEGYTRALGVLMTAVLLAAAALAIRAQPDRPAKDRWWAMVAMLLAHGSLAVQRLDAVPALLLAWALWAAVARRPAMTGVALGLATATKLFPVLLVPLLVAADPDAWRTWRARLRGALGFALAAAAGFVPMLFPPESLLDVLRYHSARGIQAESTAGALLALGHLLAGTVAPATLSYGSYNLDGATAALLARLCTPLMALLLAGATAWFVRAARADEDGSEGTFAAPSRRGLHQDVDRCDRLALALLSGLGVLWLTSRLFSPQYMTWAIPLVLAVAGKRGKTLTWLLFAILALTQVYMRAFYGQLIRGTPVGVGFLIVRLPMLVAFLVVALRGARPLLEAPREASPR
jgi:hypothetical protein